MRICFPVRSRDDVKMELTGHFGESPFFVIYDTQQESLAAYSDHAHSCRGPCRCHLPAMHQQSFDAVICRNIGARAFAMCRNNRIEVFLTRADNVLQAVQAWRANTLAHAQRGICHPDMIALRRAVKAARR